MLKELLYPDKCVICGEMVPKGEIFCKECMRPQIYVQGAVCLCCGKSVDEDTSFCQDCEKRQHKFISNRSALVYEGNSKRAMYELKYGNKRIVASYMAGVLEKQLGQWIRNVNPDGIVPIPLHKKRQKQRGYNQANLIAIELGRILDIPVYVDQLQRVEKTRPQKELKSEERENNLKNAFKIGKNAIQLKRIMLLDDIYTTGATLDAATSVLLGHGTKEVYAITVCIGNGY